MAYAVWKYDVYPYILTGKIEKINDEDGTLKIEGYGNTRFNHEKIIGDEKGKKLKNLIVNLKTEKKQINNELEERGKMKIKKLIGE